MKGCLRIPHLSKKSQMTRFWLKTYLCNSIVKYTLLNFFFSELWHLQQRILDFEHRSSSLLLYKLHSVHFLESLNELHALSPKFALDPFSSTVDDWQSAAQFPIVSSDTVRHCESINNTRRVYRRDTEEGLWWG